MLLENEEIVPANEQMTKRRNKEKDFCELWKQVYDAANDLDDDVVYDYVINVCKNLEKYVNNKKKVRSQSTTPPQDTPNKNKNKRKLKNKLKRKNKEPKLLAMSLEEEECDVSEMFMQSDANRDHAYSRLPQLGFNVVCCNFINDSQFFD